MDTESEDLVARIIAFVRSIGINVEFGKIPGGKEFLPGICIKDGGLFIDRENLKYPGDILHEAGHLSVSRPEKREMLDGNIGNNTDEDAAEEMMAIAWSYAAARHLDIDPLIVFHTNGYKGDGQNIVNNFSRGNYFGVSTLQWIGLTYEPKNAEANHAEPYPKMIKWVRE